MLTPDPTWKIIDSSKVKDVLRCPRYFFYSHILGWKSDIPSNHLVFGESWHLPMEHLLLNDYSGKSVMEGYNLFEQCYRRTFGPETDELFGGKTPFNAFNALAVYTKHHEIKHDHENYEVLHTEIGGKVSISETRSLYYKMDSIIRNKKTGEYGSLEHKTGSGVWLWADQWPLSFQVGTYTHVLNCLFKSELVEGVTINGTIFLKRKKEPYEFLRIPIPRTTNQMSVWFETANYYVSFIENHIDILMNQSEEDSILLAFPLNPESCLKWGRVCEYQDFCLAWKNPLQRCFEPPPGFVVEFWDPTKKEVKTKFDV